MNGIEDSIYHIFSNADSEKEEKRYKDLKKKAEIFFNYWDIPDRTGKINFSVVDSIKGNTINVFPSLGGEFSRIVPSSIKLLKRNINVTNEGIEIKINGVTYFVKYNRPESDFDFLY